MFFAVPFRRWESVGPVGHKSVMCARVEDDRKPASTRHMQPSNICELSGSDIRPRIRRQTPILMGPTRATAGGPRKRVMRHHAPPKLTSLP